MRTLLAATWSLGAVIGTVLLASGQLPDLGQVPGWMHVAAHVVICGVLAAVAPGSLAMALGAPLAVGLKRGFAARQQSTVEGQEPAFDSRLLTLDVVRGESRTR